MNEIEKTSLFIYSLLFTGHPATPLELVPLDTSYQSVATAVYVANAVREWCSKPCGCDAKAAAIMMRKRYYSDATAVYLNTESVNAFHDIALHLSHFVGFFQVDRIEFSFHLARV